MGYKKKWGRIKCGPRYLQSLLTLTFDNLHFRTPHTLTDIGWFLTDVFKLYLSISLLATRIKSKHNRKGVDQ